MTYFPKTKIESGDTTSVDAFGRYRVSEPFTLFDSKQLYDSQELFWATKNVNGATISHSSSRASTTMTVTTSSGSRSIRQTRRRNFYQPGKSLLCLMTFGMDGCQDGVVKRIGYFDDTNGVFLEHSGTNVNFVIRSSVSGEVVENRVSQSNWNGDSLDGTGPSGFTLDLTKVQIFAMDFQWLGVGRVRVGFSMSGSIIAANEFNH
jgi:hypothetical protein